MEMPISKVLRRQLVRYCYVENSVPKFFSPPTFCTFLADWLGIVAYPRAPYRGINIGGFNGFRPIMVQTSQ